MGVLRGERGSELEAGGSRGLGRRGRGERTVIATAGGGVAKGGGRGGRTVAARGALRTSGKAVAGNLTRAVAGAEVETLASDRRVACGCRVHA